MATTDEIRHPTMPGSTLPVGMCRLGDGPCTPGRRWHKACLTAWKDANRNHPGRLEIFERDGFICRACGEGPFEADELRDDHIVPLDIARLHEWNDLSNRQALCIACHDRKSTEENMARNSAARTRAPGRNDPEDAHTGAHYAGGAYLVPARPDPRATTRTAVGRALLFGGPSLGCAVIGWSAPAGWLATIGVALAAERGATHSLRLLRHRRVDARVEAFARLAVVTKDPATDWPTRSRIHHRSGLITPSDMTIRPGRFFTP
ncbi:MAG TPA: HNH endonuclease, partial [Kineosporiaceae bacterium]|nr:HNH endonuclease [Kineosporiaceae bacterium]